MKDKILRSIYVSIDELNEQFSDEKKLSKSKETVLFGSNGKLDSLGLVNLSIITEQIIEDNFAISITIADERAISQKHSPFRTVGSLADYIEILLKEGIDDWKTCNSYYWF